VDGECGTVCVSAGLIVHKAGILHSPHGCKLPCLTLMNDSGPSTQ
jgi:hypothetical protein